MLKTGKADWAFPCGCRGDDVDEKKTAGADIPRAAAGIPGQGRPDQPFTSTMLTACHAPRHNFTRNFTRCSIYGLVPNSKICQSLRLFSKRSEVLTIFLLHFSCIPIRVNPLQDEIMDSIEAEWQATANPRTVCLAEFGWAVSTSVHLPPLCFPQNRTPHFHISVFIFFLAVQTRV